MYLKLWRSPQKAISCTLAVRHRRDNAIIVIHTKKKEILRTLSFKAAYGLAVSPNGKYLYACSNSRPGMIAQFKTKRDLIDQVVSADEATFVTLTHDGKKIFASSLQGTLKMKTCLQKKKTFSPGAFFCLGLNREGTKAFTASHLAIQVWNTRNGQQAASIPLSEFEQIPPNLYSRTQ